MDFRQRKAIESEYRKKLLNLCPTLTDNSGIYILTRAGENGFKYAYIGQAKHILTRLTQHLMSHKQHIDNSIYKRKLWSEQNKSGWGVDFILCDELYLDAFEQQFIKDYANRGYQLYNKTSGSQGIGKSSIVETERKGYNKGLQKGYENARKDVAKMFERLKFEPKDQSKISARFYDKFKNFLENSENDEI